MRDRPLRTCNESVAKPQTSNFQATSGVLPRFHHVEYAEFTSLNLEDMKVTFE